MILGVIFTNCSQIDFYSEIKIIIMCWPAVERLSRKILRISKISNEFF